MVKMIRLMIAALFIAVTGYGQSLGSGYDISAGWAGIPVPAGFESGYGGGGSTRYLYNDDIPACPLAITGFCQLTFLGITYLGDPVKFNLNIGIADENAQVYTDYRYEIRDVATGFLEKSSTTYDWPQPIYHTSPTSGVKKISFWGPYPGCSGYSAWVPIGSAEILVVPAIQRMWIEAPPLCAADYQPGGAKAGQDYKFKIKTEPSIDQIWRAVGTYKTGNLAAGGTTCERQEQLALYLNATINPCTTGVASAQAGAAPFTGAGGTAEDVSFLKGSAYPVLPPTLAALEERTIPWAVLQNYLSGGTCPNKRIDLTLGFSDNFPTISTEGGIERIQNVSIPVATGATADNSYHNTDAVYTVTGNKTWTPSDNPFGAASVIRIKNKLRVAAGASLTIKDLTVEFGPNGSYEVDAQSPFAGTYGGKLTLDNATLTGYRGCNAEALAVWKGGTVNGCTGCDQSATGLNYKQGRLWMKNGSEISYAQTGARLAKWAIDDPTFASSGGIVTASGSRFRNNVTGVEFVPYKCGSGPGSGASSTIPACNSGSYFTNCDFTYDRYIAPYSFARFITAQNVRGIQVSGSRFKYLYAPAGSPLVPSGTGIIGYNCGITIRETYLGPPTTYPGVFTPSEFHNLLTAFYDGASVGVPAVSVKNTRFVNTGWGINAGALPAPVMQNCDFKVATTLAGTYVPNRGIYVASSNTYTIADNTLDAHDPTVAAGSLGVVAWNTGSQPNKIERNSYGNLKVGNLSNYINRGVGLVSGEPIGLEFLCNNYSAVSTDQAATGSNATTDGIRIRQGNPIGTPNPRPASNLFNNGSGHVYDINNNSLVAGITYYYGPGANQFPDQRVGSVTPASVSDEYNCGSVGSGLTPRDPLGPMTKGPDAATLPSGPTPSAMRFARLLHDEPHKRDSMYYYAGQMNDPYGDLITADLLLEDGQLGQMDAVYNGIVTKYSLVSTEATEFSYWGRRLFNLYKSLTNSGRGMHELQTAEAAELAAIADSASMWAKIRAQGWLGLYDGRTFQNPTLLPQDGQGGGARMAPTTEESIWNGGYAVYPNPATDALTVRYPTIEGEQPVFEATDLTGRRIMRTSLDALTGKQTVDVSALRAGVYIWRITGTGGKELAHGKVTKL